MDLRQKFARTAICPGVTVDQHVSKKRFYLKGSNVFVALNFVIFRWSQVVS